MQTYDVVVLGAGAAGLMCAIEAARRGRRTAVLDHARAPGEKIRISGGGRCNFTNLHIAPDRFISQNPRFAISALSRYTQHDFIARVDAAGIAWHEKTLGQLFCDGPATAIVAMLVSDLRAAGGELRLGTAVGAVERNASSAVERNASLAVERNASLAVERNASSAVERNENFAVARNASFAVEPTGGFVVETAGERIAAASLVVATGGLSVPKMGATGLAYRLAQQFGVSVVPTRPGLVPLTFGPDALAPIKDLAGIAVRARIACNGAGFEEGLLFTHRGLSGPSVLQVSSYWRPGAALAIDLCAGRDVGAVLRAQRAEAGRISVKNALARMMPEKLARHLTGDVGVSGALADQTNAALDRVAAAVQDWRVVPTGSEGYRTAEVTVGGVDTGALDARTMQCRTIPGLFFVGEAVDVTGWLGGYNFQWAWSSGWAAGQVA